MTVFFLKMDSDDVIELFSNEVFRNLFRILKYNFEITDCSTKLENKNVAQSFVLQIVYISYLRHKLFRKYLQDTIFYDREKFSRSKIEFDLYFTNNVNKFYPSLEMSTFDKICMSVAILQEMCGCCLDNKDVLKIVPICWAKHFKTELINHFVYEGGWLCFKERISKNMLVFSKLDVEKEEFFENGFFDIKSWVQNEMKIYDMSFLRNLFENELRDNEFPICQRCSPMFVAFLSLINRDYPLNTALEVEGYIMLTLRLLTDKDVKEIERLVTIRKEGVKLEDEKETFDKSKSLETLEELFSCAFFWKIFQKPLITLNKIVSLIERNPPQNCVICFQNLNQSFESLSRKFNNEKPTKSSFLNITNNIANKEIKSQFTEPSFCASKLNYSEKISAVDKQNDHDEKDDKYAQDQKGAQSDKCLGDEQEARNKNGIQNIVVAEEETSSQDKSGPGDEICSRDQKSALDEKSALNEKSALRMFLGLGVEPVRSVLLHSLTHLNIR